MDKKTFINKKNSYQSGGIVNGYDNLQKPIMDVREVSTDGIREGSLQPGDYYRVIYKDGSKDYLRHGNTFREFQRMPNYIEYMKTIQNKAQQGGMWQPAPYALTYPSMLNNFTQSPYVGRPEPVTESDFQGSPFPTTSAKPPTDYLQSQYQISNTGYVPRPEGNTISSIPTPQTQYNDITRYNVVNPFSGIDLDTSLAYAGQGFGSGNYTQAGLGAGLSVLKGARNFLTGYASGKESNRVKKEMYNDLYNPNTNYSYLQEGGEINTPSNAQMLTGKFIADEGIGNVNLENNEYVKRNATGDIQLAVGEPHMRNGKEAEGIDVMLQNGDKVLSDYTKIPPKNIKELKERYSISLRKVATFADAQKAYDKKIGVKKTTDELTDYIEKFGKNDSVQDPTSKRLNETVLTKQIEETQLKLDALKAPQSEIFEDLFSLQESIPKRGDGELLDKNGKPIEQKNKEVYQQGGMKELEAFRKKYPNAEKRFTRPDDKSENWATDNSAYYTSFTYMPDKPIVRPHEKVYGVDSLQPSDLQYIDPNATFSQADLVNQYIQPKYWDVQDNTNQNFGATQTNYRVTPQNADYTLRTIAPEPYNSRVSTPSYQQGGEIEDLAGKYGISLSRAHELLTMQSGGEVPQQQSQQPSQEQVMQIVQAYAQAQGIDPQQIIDQLQQMSPEQLQQALGQMVQELQGQQEQAPQETAPVQEEQAIAQQGGEKQYMQQAGFSFSTRYTPEIPGYDVAGNSIVNQDSLQNVELTQPYTGTGYGAQMRNVEDTINLHKWYFDTEEKKQAFREATKKEGQQKEIIDFQNAYNKELRKRAEDAGVAKKEANDIINQVGFSGKGAQQFDGKFGAFTSTRPLYDFKKSPENKEVVVEAITPQGSTQTRNITKDVFPLFPQDLKLAPSALNPIAKEQIALGRIQPVKQSIEPYLASAESQRQSDVARIQQSGLSPAQQEALLSQGLASSQMSTNDAIARTEAFNAQSQANADQFNIGQASKEQLTNANFNQVYQGQVLGGLNNYERDLRSYYNEANAQNRQNYKDVENLNLINSTYSNYQYIPGQGSVFLNNRASTVPITSEPTQTEIDNMTPEQYNAYIKTRTAQLNNVADKYIKFKNK